MDVCILFTKHLSLKIIQDTKRMFTWPVAHTNTWLLWGYEKTKPKAFFDSQGRESKGIGIE
jgi:hypothetical protein